MLVSSRILARYGKWLSMYLHEHLATMVNGIIVKPD